VKFMEMDWESGIPIWLQVKQGILHAILSGSFKPGYQLPTVRQLAVELSINYNTVNKAYMDLEREGFIVSRRGRGTFISQQDELTKEGLVEDLIDAFLQKLLDAGFSSKKIMDLIEQRINKLDLRKE